MGTDIFVSLLPGDCLALMRELEEESIDCILCDLPYGGMTRNKWDQSLPEQELWRHYRRLIKPPWGNHPILCRQIHCIVDPFGGGSVSLHAGLA